MKLLVKQISLSYYYNNYCRILTGFWDVTPSILFLYYLEDGGSSFLRNFGKHIPHLTASLNHRRDNLILMTSRFAPHW
jgi:hypothetical protein